MGQSTQRQGIVVAAAGVALLASFAVPSDSYAIGGGKAAKAAPWAVQVYDNGQFTCTATMLTGCWVLSAAPCHQDRPGAGPRMYAGV